jgi:protein-S-isoprenylcysteine O-methyltransferase Ste14
MGWRQQDRFVRAGRWLFRQRSWLPVPIAVALIFIPSSSTAGSLRAWGVALAGAGEMLRLLGVRQIGAVSRTRSDRLGPLVADGPFRYVRNPLYIGNIALWLGFVLIAGLPWLVLPIGVILALEYHAIVRWEEELLRERLGAAYVAYTARVPRWVPRFTSAGGPASGSQPVFGWRETFFSERGTLIAIAVGVLLLWLKESFRAF